MTALRVVKTFEFTCERKRCVFRADVPPKRCPVCRSPYWQTKRGVLPKGRPKRRDVDSELGRKGGRKGLGVKKKRRAK